MDDRIKTIREAFAGERFVNESLGAVIEDAAEGYAKCTMTIEPRHYNSFGTLMGGAIFTLADFAFAVAANQDGKAVVSQAVQITFLTPAVGKTLTAEAGVIREGGKTSFYSVVVTDELGTEVAFATANGYLVSRE
jgi:acyl-CoA thioesterase